jgi:hypothetical protein
MKKISLFLVLVLVVTVILSTTMKNTFITGANENVFAALTESDLRQMLDDYEVAYLPSASRQDLIRLVQQHESNPSASTNQDGSVSASSSPSTTPAQKRGRGHRLLFSTCVG